MNEPRFNGVHSRNNLPKTIKKGAYIINLGEYENTGTHGIALFVKTNEAIYFDGFGIEHIPKEINKFIGNISVFACVCVSVFASVRVSVSLCVHVYVVCGFYCVCICFVFFDSVLVKRQG